MIGSRATNDVATIAPKRRRSFLAITSLVLGTATLLIRVVFTLTYPLVACTGGPSIPMLAGFGMMCSTFLGSSG